MTLARIVRAERRGPTVVRGEVYGAQLEAAGVREAATREAQQLIAAAREDIERASAAGFAAGFADGHAEGCAAAARELLEITAAREAAVRAQERQLRELALLLAGKLTAHAFEHEPAALRALIESLLPRVRRARRVVVRVHPEAEAFVRSRLSQLLAAAELDGALQVVSDPAIEHGGCLIESEIGELDARLQTRLSELGRALGWESA
jgi:flagellar biosynthesis/type III secretory pathway protein FliH